jgi:hypothetical protein
MNLYRFEVTIDTGVIHVIVAAENEEMAFKQADIEIERHFVKIPKVLDMTLYEKRVIKQAAGFVLSRNETIL